MSSPVVPSHHPFHHLGCLHLLFPVWPCLCPASATSTQKTAAASSPDDEQEEEKGPTGGDTLCCWDKLKHQAPLNVDQGEGYITSC